jgi:hypothetical protein
VSSYEEPAVGALAPAFLVSDDAEGFAAGAGADALVLLTGRSTKTPPSVVSQSAEISAATRR